MAFDPSIIMGYKGMGDLPNPMNQLAQVSQIQNAQNQNALSQFQLSAAQRAEQGQTATGQAYAKFYTDQPTGASGQPSFGQMRQQIVQSLSNSAPHLIPGELAKIAAMEKESLQTKELQGKIDLQAPELQNKVSEQFKKQLINVNSYDSAVSWLKSQYQNPVLGPIVSQEPFESAVQLIPKDPVAFADWKNKNALGIEEYIKQNKPQLSTQDRGGVVTDRLFKPLSGEITDLGTTAKTPTPGDVLTDARGKAQLAQSAKQHNENKAQQLLIAGLSPDGQLSDANEQLAQGIAAGKFPPPSGLALMRPVSAQIMSRVAQLNPEYDATNYAAKTKAAKDFTSGSQGNAMRSFNVAGSHLEQLSGLVDALDNKNVQAINKFSNIIAEQTGNTNITNFDAAKDVVSKEVIKAIVGGGGGVSEREELSKLMSNAKTPKQLKGVIQQYRGLMDAQYKALLEQRRAAGLSDETLPKYEKSVPSGNVDMSNPLLK